MKCEECGVEVHWIGQRLCYYCSDLRLQCTQCRDSLLSIEQKQSLNCLQEH